MFFNRKTPRGAPPISGDRRDELRRIAMDRLARYAAEDAARAASSAAGHVDTLRQARADGQLERLAPPGSREPAPKPFVDAEIGAALARLRPDRQS